MKTISKKQAEEFFDACDTDGSGTVSIQELVMKICGCMNSNNDEVMQMFTDVDKDSNGSITKPEFFDEVCKKPREDSINEFFDMADSDDNNSISKSELTAIISKSGGKLDPKVLEDIFDQADADDSGCISKDEFKKAMFENY